MLAPCAHATRDVRPPHALTRPRLTLTAWAVGNPVTQAAISDIVDELFRDDPRRPSPGLASKRWRRMILVGQLASIGAKSATAARAEARGHEERLERHLDLALELFASPSGLVARTPGRSWRAHPAGSLTGSR